MIALIYLAALGAVFFPSTVTGCDITAAQIDAFYGTVDGFWRIRLGWSSENPDCKVHLEEEVDDKEKFEISDSKECKKGEYCYFKTSKQCCSNGKMQYRSMKFSTECSCNVASFTFTIQGLLSGNSSVDCKYIMIILPGQEPRRQKVDDMEFRECGEPCSLVKIPRDCQASGCYCKNNFVLDITTGLCSSNRCPDIFEPIPMNLNCLASGCYCKGDYILDPTTGLCSDEKCIIEEPPVISFNLTVGSCYPIGEFVTIRLHLEANRNYTYNLTSLTDNGVISIQHFRGSSLISGSSKIGFLRVRPPGLGDYTIEVVDLLTENKYSERGYFSIQRGCLPSIPIILSVPECNRFSSGVTISWNAQDNREYEYKITELISSKEVSSGTLTGNGIVTIPGRVLKVGSYKVTVEDLSTENKSMNSTDFEIKAGCEEPKDLNPDVNPYCNKSGVQVTEITWDVVASRRYSYEIRVKGTSENDKALPRGEGSGSGTGDFVVSNGKAFLAFSLEPNDYVLTVKDLDAGVEDFYMESIHFSVEECPQYHPLNLMVPGCVKSTQSSIEISWNVLSDREYSYKVEGGDRTFAGKKLGSMKSDDFKVEGDRGTLTITSLTEWTVAIYNVTVRDLTSSVPTVETKQFEIRKGCEKKVKLNPNVKPYCNKTGVQITEITWDVVESRRYSYEIRVNSMASKEVIHRGEGSGLGTGDFAVSDNKAFLAFSLEPNDYVLTIKDLDVGVKEFYKESKTFSVKDCPPYIPLNLTVPGCVKSTQSCIEISWNVKSDREYSYKVRGGGRKFKGKILGSMESDDFKVEGDRGTLTITSSTEWTLGIYKVTVSDLTSSVTTVETKQFEIRKGCKKEIPLDIDGEGMCVKRFSYLQVSWKVENDRTYKYSISKEGTTVQEATVPGSGSDGFPVDNGRGQLRLKLEPGDYRVRVQDLDAGVREFYTEYENFSVKACNFEIEISNCVEKGQTVNVPLLAFPKRTYKFSVLVENTGQAVLNGSFLSGVSQNGVVTTYELDSSDSLPVGRYRVLIREVETGGKGYGRFDINSNGNIGEDVKYRANAFLDRMYVCLDPREGLVFVSGLTYKTNNSVESSLQGPGICLEEAYGGGQGTLVITIKKDGEMAGRVDIDYVG